MWVWMYTRIRMAKPKIVIPEVIHTRTKGIEPELRAWRRKHPFAPWSALLRPAIRKESPRRVVIRRAMANLGIPLIPPVHQNGNGVGK
jgi:hypothetical protein